MKLKLEYILFRNIVSRIVCMAISQAAQYGTISYREKNAGIVQPLAETSCATPKQVLALNVTRDSLATSVTKVSSK